jgi:hypothetical protein
MKNPSSHQVKERRFGEYMESRLEFLFSLAEFIVRESGGEEGTCVQADNKGFYWRRVGQIVPDYHAWPEEALHKIKAWRELRAIP